MNCCIPDDYVTFESVDWQKARLQHKCCECGIKIKKGDEYQVIKQLFEGNWYRYKTCEKCADLRDSISQVWCTYVENLRADYLDFCNETGKFSWTYDEENIIYPENHLKLNE